ncbi:MAG: NosD domain-containing protein [Candidatus Kariarchaeaceae archaeon]
MKLLIFLLLIYSFNQSIQIRSEGDTNASILSQEENNGLSLSFTDSVSINIASDADFITQGYSGSGTSSEPYLIKGLNITTSEGTLIAIHNISSHFIIRDCIFNGIDGQFTGILLMNSEYGTIDNNTITNSRIGIELNGSNHILVTNNFIRTNTLNGINLSDSSNITIAYNTISENQNGIVIQASRNTIKNNNITKNTLYGVIIENGIGNTIVWNNFIYNNQPNSQASDSGLDNEFIINFWHDWTSPDSNQDGIVDMTYEIDGSANNSDAHPIIAKNMVEKIISTNTEESTQETFIERYQLLILLAFLLALIFVIVKWLLNRLQRIRWEKLGRTTIKGILGVVPPLLFSIINASEREVAKFELLVPPELYSFKFLLNPIRLAILKMLHEYDRYPSFMLRDALGLTWGNYSSNIDVLENKGYIQIKEEFIDGTARKVVYLEERGSMRYNELQQILQELFKKY